MNIFRQDKLGVAPVIGFLLIFSFLILGAAQYQTTVVPTQEENTEIQHSQEVRDQMVGLQNSIDSSVSNGEIQTQEIQLGTSFESQIIFGIIPAVNAPSPAGQLEFEQADAELLIDNAIGQRAAASYWDGSEENFSESEGGEPDRTGWIKYEPDYTHFQDAPTTYYENGLVYDEFEDEEGEAEDPVFQTDQQVVNNRNIRLTTLASDLSVSSIGQRTVEVDPISSPRTTVAVEAPEDEDLIIQVPTRLDVEDWEELLEDERVSEGGFVRDISEGQFENAVQINLLEDETYTLGLARVFITTRESDAASPTMDREYIGFDEEQVIIREESRTAIDAQARDRYNNPIIGQRITATAQDQSGRCIGNFQSGSGAQGVCSGDGVDQPGERISAEEGRVTFIYEAPEVDEDTDIDITLDFEDD